MVERKSSYDEYWTNKKADIFVIYDLDTCEIYEIFRFQSDCIKCYQDFYDGFVNVAWCKLDIIDFLRKDRLPK